MAARDQVPGLTQCAHCHASFFVLQPYGITLMVANVLNPFQMLLLFYGITLW